MGTFWAVLIIVFVTFTLAVALINIRGIVKGEEFRGTCATNNPMLKAKIGECTVCGKQGNDPCQMPEIKSA